MVKPGYIYERERQLVLQELGYHVVRCSGSIGAMDLVCTRAIFASTNNSQAVPKLPPIVMETHYEQVKSLKGKTFYFDKQSLWELERLQEIQSKFCIPCFFAIKFKRKGWLVKDVSELRGKPIKFEKSKPQPVVDKVVTA
jgi:Holliday junction resolvase